MLDANTTALLAQMGIDAASIESLLSTLVLLSVVALVTAIPTGMIAGRKGRSRTLWVLFALSIPLLPLLLVWVLPAAPAKLPPAEK